MMLAMDFIVARVSWVRGSSRQLQIVLRSMPSLAADGSPRTSGVPGEWMVPVGMNLLGFFFSQRYQTVNLIA